jgi:hypothetical protein
MEKRVSFTIERQGLIRGMDCADAAIVSARSASGSGRCDLVRRADGEHLGAARSEDWCFRRISDEDAGLGSSWTGRR